MASKNTKAIIDVACGVVGSIAAAVVASAAGFGQYAGEATIVGLAVGYAASDIAVAVDTGQMPTIEELAPQVAELLAKAPAAPTKAQPGPG